MEERTIKLAVSVDVAAASLESYYTQRGGSKLLPRLERVETKTSLVQFRLTDRSAEISATLIEFKPAPNNLCELTLYVNESSLWGWMIGVPGRSEIGVTTYLGGETSDRASSFCRDYVKYLGEREYVVDEKKRRDDQISPSSISVHGSNVNAGGDIVAGNKIINETHIHNLSSTNPPKKLTRQRKSSRKRKR